MITEDCTPWTTDQLGHLRWWQDSGEVHPYTCGGGGGPCSGVSLAVTPGGLVCPGCGRIQSRVHDFSLAGTFRRPPPGPPKGSTP